MTTVSTSKGPTKIRIKYFNEDTKRLTKIPQGDWIDLYADKDMVIPQFDHALIPLGFAMELPSGYEAHVLPRSSTYKNWGLIVANNMGIIDEDYNGDNDQWLLSVICIRPNSIVDKKPVTIVKRGDKIAQFRIVEKMPPVEFVEVSELGNDDRGGYGTTGTK